MGGFERTRNVAATSVIPPDPIVDVSQTLLSSTSLTPALSRNDAKGMGFTGNQCNVCSGMRMRISGHCEVCEECGNSSGCS